MTPDLLFACGPRPGGTFLSEAIVRKRLAEIRQGDAVLYAAGWLWLALLAVAGVLSVFDPRTILGIDPWIKPMKFLISFHLYSWSVAWIFGCLRAPRPVRWFLRWGIVASLVIAWAWRMAVRDCRC